MNEAETVDNFVGTCPFCRIIHGLEPSWIVFEDDVSIAFLDRRPLFPGHVLLVPRTHVENFDELPQELAGPLFGNAQQLSKAVQSGVDAEGSFIAINNRVSQSVAHLHIHIVPRRSKDGLKGFFWPRHPYQTREEAEHVQKSLRDEVSRLEIEGGTTESN